MEIPVLSSMRDIEIRATMHLILINENKVEDFYDLSDEHLKLIYVRLVNTSFEKKETIRLLKVLKGNG